MLFVLTLLCAGLSGCQQDHQPTPKVEVGPQHSHTAKKASTVVVPPFVAGKWKAVRIAVIDKTNVSQKVYTVPIGGSLAVPASNMSIKVETFLPAFIMEGTTLTSSSNDLTNPGIKVQITEKGLVLFSGWIFSKFPNTHAFMHPRYGFSLLDAVPAK
jgi:hypothetical protein